MGNRCNNVLKPKIIRKMGAQRFQKKKKNLKYVLVVRFIIQRIKLKEKKFKKDKFIK